MPPYRLTAFRLPTSALRLPTSDLRLPPSDLRPPTSDLRPTDMPSVLLLHPTGNTFVRNALIAFEDAGILAEFHTGVATFPGNLWDRLSKTKLGAEFTRRCFDPRIREKTVQHPSRELSRLIAQRIGLQQLIAHETGHFSVDRVYRAMDRTVARRVRQLAWASTSQAPGAVYACEDGALETFRAAKAHGLRCLYDLPIGYWRAARRIQAEEAERLPEWAATMPALVDSEAKLARKDEELQLADQIIVASSFTAQTLAEAPFHLPKPVVIPYGCPEVGGRTSEVGGRRSEVGGRTSEVGGRTSEVGGRRSEVGGRRSANRRREAESTRQKVGASETELPTADPRSPISDVRFPSSDLRPPVRVLFVGGLSQRKGLSYLFAAVEALGASVALTLIGRKPGVACRPLEAALAKYRWIPSLPHEEILATMRAHDVLVFPSLFEGFGLVLTEALSQGLPVITTAHTCGPDILTDGKDGFIVPIRDSQAIVEKLELLHKDRDRLAAMSTAAVETARRVTWASYRRSLTEAVSR